MTKDEEKLLELEKIIAYAQIAYLNARTVEETRYWKGYNDAIDELLNIVRIAK
jgi:hypothetical protein